MDTNEVDKSDIYDEIILNKASFRKLTAEIDNSFKELNEYKTLYEFLQEKYSSLRTKYDEEIIKIDFLTKKQQESEQTINRLTKSFHGSEELVSLYKNKCEKLEEQAKCNRSGLINYMRTNTEKIASLEEKIANQDTELKKYKEALEKMYE
jgi:chromosome segregation ATPase